MAEELYSDITATMREVWGLSYQSRSQIYDVLFRKFLKKGINFGWIPRTASIFIGFEHENQLCFRLGCTHDELGWAVSELAGVGNTYYWNGFQDNC